MNLVAKRPAVGIVQMRVGGVVASLKIDYVAVWVLVEPDAVALVVVAVFVSGHCLILWQWGPLEAHFGG